MTTSHVIASLISFVLGGVIAWALTRASFSAQLARSRAETAHVRQYVEDVLRAQDRLTDAFESLSAQALKNNSDQFLNLAEQRLNRAHTLSQTQLAQREQAIKSLVEPLNEALSGVKQHLSAVERDRAQAHGSLTAQIAAMSRASALLQDEASQLASALRTSHVRGRWGEMHLRRVVEAAGMVDHVDFTEQLSLETHEGKQRPDMVVHLPGDKHVVVDAKAPLNAFLDAIEEPDESKHRKLFNQHARNVRHHIHDLASKAYWQALDATPEFVVMFLPTDAMLTTALQTDAQLLDEAFTRNVVLATPSTFVALLRTIAYTWRQDRLAQEAQTVFTQGRELHRRLGIFGRHLNDLARRLNSAVDTFNALNRSVDSTLVPQAKRFAELQGLDDPVDAPTPVESHAVPAAKPDLFQDGDWLGATEGEAD